MHLKNFSNSTFLCWKAKSPIFYCLKRKKRKFVPINLLVEIFLFCMCVFWNKKYILSYTFNLCGRVGDKKIFIRPNSGNKTTCFGLSSQKIRFLEILSNFAQNWLIVKQLWIIWLPINITHFSVNTSIINK